jgi:hypothetical protein
MEDLLLESGDVAGCKNGVSITSYSVWKGNLKRASESVCSRSVKPNGLLNEPFELGVAPQ